MTDNILYLSSEDVNILKNNLVTVAKYLFHIKYISTDLSKSQERLNNSINALEKCITILKMSQNSHRND